MRSNQLISDFNRYLNSEGIKVYELERRDEVVQTYSRKDFYKVSFLSGNGIIQYNGCKIKLDGPVLLISKPGTVCHWTLVSGTESSYVCLFTKHYLNNNCFHWVDHSELFTPEGRPVFTLTPEEAKFVTSIFCKMISKENSIYRYKSELMRDQLCALLHLALRTEASINFTNQKSTITSVATLFVELAEMQFPPEAQVVHYN